MLSSVVFLHLVLCGLTYVAGDFQNVAMNMPVYASSTHSTYYPSHVTNNLVDGRVAQGGCGITSNEESPWMIVDLLERKYVSEVRVRTRSDSPQQFEQISIRVGDTFDPNDLAQTRANDFAVCGTFETNPGVNIDAIAECETALPGRYVGVFMHKKNYLTVCEIMVAATGGSMIDITDNVVPFISSHYTANGYAENAFDGVSVGIFAKGSCAMTGNDPQPWLAADMRRREKVVMVVLKNREENYGKRLEHAYVAVGTRFSPYGSHFVDLRYWKTCAYLRGPYGNGEHVVATCPAPLVDTRFVMIYMVRTEYLTICEMTIMVEKQ